MRKIVIIGSGLVGTLLSIYLAKRGYEVEVFESRADPRLTPIDKGRSINLAMSCRGLTGLAEIGLKEVVRPILVPMRARAIHERDEIIYQPFGRDSNEYINAVQRNELNILLLNEAEKNPLIRQHFSMQINAIDFSEKKLTMIEKDGQVHTYDYERLIGADGANSVLRQEMVKNRFIEATRDFLPHGYKELSITNRHSSQFAPEHLHLWPRDSFLLLGNPNTDDSITGSLFLPHEGKNSFAELDSELKINTFFREAFPDAYSAMPHLLSEFIEHPTGNMSNIHCTPWHYQDQCMLIGDAAHGIVPFFGQGMNCGFEDCRVLNVLLDQYNDDWQLVMPAFYAMRKPNTEAVAAMSMDNYHEIQVDIRDENFHLKKQIERELMHHYSQRYISKHVLVMFTNTAYHKAQMIGLIQEELLHKICSKAKEINTINWNEIDKLMDQYDKNLAQMIS